MPEAAPDSHALLMLDNAACARGGRVLWRGLSLRLMAGDAIHVTGSNGCGKSSLLRAAAGLLPVLAGNVTRGGAAGLVDENPALDRTMPLAGALDFWARIGDGTMAPYAALAAVGIAQLADVPVRILSTGQRKRAALARLLIEARPLWLLDEPGNGLDADGMAMLAALIAAHRAAGGAVLLASHQLLPLPELVTIHLPDFAA
jgi:heme exporter protein A